MIDFYFAFGNCATKPEQRQKSPVYRNFKILQCTIRNVLIQVRRISKLISGLIKSVDHRIGGKTSDAVAAFHVEAGKSLTDVYTIFP